MNEVSLWEAWGIWLSGKSVQNMQLWGVNILWLGRIGKIAEFVAALTILVDIIGPERIRKFGNSLHSAFTLHKAKNVLADSFKFLAVQDEALSYAEGDFDRAMYIAETGKQYKSYKLNPYLSAIFTTITIITSVLGWPGLQSRLDECSPLVQIIAVIIIFYFIYSIFHALITSVLIFFGAVFISTVGFIIDAILIEPLAWAMEREYIDRWLKILSILVLVLGFHFDLLAS